MDSATSFVLSGAGLLTMYLAPRKPMWAWTLALSVQPLWIWWALTYQQYGFLATTAVYILIYCSNVYRTLRVPPALSGEACTPTDRNQ